MPVKPRSPLIPKPPPRLIYDSPHVQRVANFDEQETMDEYQPFQSLLYTIFENWRGGELFMPPEEAPEDWVDPNGRILQDRMALAGSHIKNLVEDRLFYGQVLGKDIMELENFLIEFLIDIAGGGHGGTSIAHTELARGHGVGQQFAYETIPFKKGIKWTLSSAHKGIDACVGHANRKTALGVGIYPPDNLPQYPAHPFEKCLLELILKEPNELTRKERQEFVEFFLGGVQP